eukprot:663143-Rhodomonas_salina.3
MNLTQAVEIHGNNTCAWWCSHLQVASGEYGVVTLSITATDSGGRGDGGIDTSLPRAVSLIVLPRPAVHGVSPAIAPNRGGTKLTVTGMFFGSVSREEGDFSLEVLHVSLLQALMVLCTLKGVSEAVDHHSISPDSIACHALH